jgi:hypothetical protein
MHPAYGGLDGGTLRWRKAAAACSGARHQPAREFLVPEAILFLT